ncbi:MAG: hypothetical protein GF307_11740 [candidate division Zixibacteria bacterium]|nr:hypothetical protein [candidate division Zixibacteria bacterium]
MEFEKFSESYGKLISAGEDLKEKKQKPVDLSRAKDIKITRDTYLEAQEKGLTLSELLETRDYDPSPVGSALDAFERQLAAAGIKINGGNSSTVELFYRGAPALMPEFIMREIRKGMSLHPDLNKLVASSSVINSNRYTPFYIDTTPGDTGWSMRPVGDGAEIPSVLVNEQKHTITVPDYGVSLKATYKSLRHRSTAQFKVLLWYLGYRLQVDKNGILVDTIINGDGNSNPAAVTNTDVTGTLDYDDLIKFYNELYPFEMNALIAHKNTIRTILTLDEFKDPMAGFQFHDKGDMISPLGARLVRCDEVPADYVLGLDNRFAIEEVISQPLLVEYDKIIDQKIEEAVISESVAYAKIVESASQVLDIDWAG